MKNKKSKKGGSSRQQEEKTDTSLVPMSATMVYTDRLKLRPAVDQIYRCRRTWQGSSISQAVSANFGSPTITFSLVEDASNLAGVFDQYRIAKVEMVFRLTASTAVANISGNFYTALDYDDNAALTTVPQILDYSSCIVTPLSGTGVSFNHRRCFVPRVAGALWANSAFQGYEAVVAPWINSASNGVPHYGVKYALDAYAASASMLTITPYITVELELKASR